MKTFTALIDIGDPDGRYTKIEHQSASLEDAQAELEARYGLGKVYSVAEPIEHFKP